MEADQGGKQQRSRQKRRERALQLQHEKDEETHSGPDESPPRSNKDKRKPKNGKLYHEDIIDGFSIMSFKSFEDLEVRHY